jgi:hypothetical protein
MSKLWIIGDSFAGSAKLGQENWTQQICSKFKGDDYYVSSKGGRDFQTILDIFLRNLKNIQKDDFVILLIPSLIRTRLPLATPQMDVEHSNIKDNKIKQKIVDYFLSASMYRNETKNLERSLLEDPLANIDEFEARHKSEVWSIVNSSNASKKNYIEILKSLKSYLPFEIFVWSWENEIQSDIVMNKNQIVDAIGFWHTLRDLYEETNGQDGKLGDAHWSLKTHKAFADYLIIKFPQFFNV